MDINIPETIVSVCTGALAGRIGGAGANEKMFLTNTAKNARNSIEREARRANQKYAQKAIASTVKYTNGVFTKTVCKSSYRFAIGTGISNLFNNSKAVFSFFKRIF